MIIQNDTGLLEEIHFLSSPNCDHRPDGYEICLLVIHNISLPPRIFGGTAIDDLFCNCLDAEEHAYFKEVCHLRVSSHLLIRRNGAMTQYVPFTQRAWHAGESSFQGQEKCNDFSIGIELEGADDIPYTLRQYNVLAEVTKVLIKNYPRITLDRIVGHSHIAPSRKTDPGESFDWDYYRYLLEIGNPT